MRSAFPYPLPYQFSFPTIQTEDMIFTLSHIPIPTSVSHDPNATSRHKSKIPNKIDWTLTTCIMYPHSQKNTILEQCHVLVYQV